MQALSLYIKRIGKDYLTVFKDVLLESRQKPIKASFYISLISAAYYAKITRPDESLYISKLVELRQEMVLLPNSIHSSTADKKLEEITKFCINNRIDIYDCIFFSLVVARAYDKKSSLYIARDSLLKSWPWVTLWENLIDVGALNHFWNLERHFVDYDIRQEEFQTTIS